MTERVAGWYGGGGKREAQEIPLPVVPEQVQQRAGRLLEILEGWHVPPVTLQAARLLPLAWEYETGWRQLVSDCDQEVAELVNNWLELYYLTTVPEAGIDRPISKRSLKLRRLMRKAYINLPLVLLTVADHAVRLEWAEKEGADSADTVQSLYEETRDVFLPLMRMLGLWEMRQPWADRALRQLHPEQYATLSRTAERYNKDAARYHEELNRRLKELIVPDDFRFELKVAHTDAGVLHGHSDIGHSIQERLENLTLDISVEDTADCYRMLAYVHHLGTVVQSRFRDYITAPRPNGYRALQTAISFNQDTARFRERLIRFRIFSKAMQEVNQRGIIADQLAPLAGHIREGQASSRHFWWSQTRQNNNSIDLLHTRPFGPLAGSGGPVYIFTPYGEVKSLPAGSNVLDFIYRLHSRQAHHCRQALVNGYQVPHNTELHNGDLVHLVYDFNFHGPDPSWLNFARNESTRKHIRRGLNLGLQANLPPGKLRIERLLERIRNESGFVVPTPQKERYLIRVADETGLGGDLASLFRAVEAPVRGIRVSPERVVSFILESELYTAVVDGENRPIIPPDQQRQPEYHRSVLRFCPNCRPTPGNAIAVHRRHNRYGEERPVLHRADMVRTCLGPAQGHTSRIDRNVQWGHITSGHTLVSNLTVVATDRPGLVGDLIDFVYNNDRIDLTYLMAATDNQGVADIRMTVTYDKEEELDRLHKEIAQAEGVNKVSVWEVSPAQYAHLQTRSQGRQGNPFSINPVAEIGMLYGREREQQAIIQAVESENPAGVIVLHGQRRSGKTSLARLARIYVQGMSRAIYIDMLPLTGEQEPALLLRHIASGIWNELRLGKTSDIPAPPAPEEWQQAPVRQWRNWLARVREWLHPSRMLLIVDEFNAVVAACANPLFYDALRGAALEEKNSLTLLLVTHTSQFRQLPPGHPASLIYGQGVPLELERLPDHSARRLVQEPTRAWLMFSNAIANRIAEITDGHPLLINMLCGELVRQANHTGKREIDLAALQAGERWLQRDGLLHFNFLTENIGKGDRPIVEYLCDRHTQGQEWVPVSAIARHIGRNPLQVQAALNSLKQHCVVATTSRNNQNQARIAVPCFSEWVYNTWSG
jgi:GTP pyrophosphokinase